MLIRTDSMCVMCAAVLILTGCASNGQPAKDTPAPQETAEAAPMSVVVPVDRGQTPAKSSTPDSTATAEPAVKPSTPDSTATAEPAVVNMMAVDIYLRGPDFHYARWGVQSDGTLRYADGRHARSSEWGWTGQVTPAQAQSINAIAAKWMTDRPKGDDSNGEAWEVRVQGADGSTTFTVNGHSPSVAEVWSIFDTAGAGLTLTEVDQTTTQNLDRLFRLESAQTQVDDE